MYCIACGTNLPANSNFCYKCGQEAYTPTVQEAEGSASNTCPPAEIKPLNTTRPPPQATVSNPAKPAKITGTKWLKFWTYFSLPFGAIVGLFACTKLPEDIGFFVGLLAILQLCVAFGLHGRSLWAWKWNWVVIAVTLFSIALPTQHGNSPVVLITQFVVKIIFGGLVWLWPNYVYWMKRKKLFS